MSNKTFINYQKGRYFWLSLGLLTLLSLIYYFDQPVGGRNGGTFLGYTYGILAALIILYLAYFGIRKRSYHKSSDTVQGWLAAHVWLGILLLVLVPLHSGFSFALNIHTLAYFCMCLVVLSGIWGAYNYIKVAPQVPSHRGQGTVAQMLESRMQIRRDLNQLLSSSVPLNNAFSELFKFWEPSIRAALFSKLEQNIDAVKAAQALATLNQDEREQGLKLISLLNRSMELDYQLSREIKAKVLLKLWLYMHVPLTFALLVTLSIHIFSVFFYW